MSFIISSTYFLPFAKTSSCEHIQCLAHLAAQLDFPRYILMALCNRLICNLEVAVKDKERHSWNLRKSLLGERWGGSFSSKIKIKDMSSRLSEYIPEQTVSKELLNFYKIKVCTEVCILKLVRMYSFTGALKAPVLLFQVIFKLN